MTTHARSAPGANVLSSSTPSDVVRSLHDDVINAGRLERFDELIAPDYRNHGPFPWGVRDRDDLRRFYVVRELGFPDAQVTTEALLETGPFVSYRITVRGTDSGEFLGMPPTGEPFEIGGLGIARIRDGQVVEHWGLVDELGLLEQLGMPVEAIPRLRRPGRPAGTS